MYICICNAITEREVRQCAELGACSVADLERCLGLGTNCGKCRDSAAAVLDASRPIVTPARNSPDWVRRSR